MNRNQPNINQKGIPSGRQDPFPLNNHRSVCFVPSYGYDGCPVQSYLSVWLSWTWRCPGRSLLMFLCIASAFPVPLKNQSVRIFFQVRSRSVKPCGLSFPNPWSVSGCRMKIWFRKISISSYSIWSIIFFRKMVSETWFQDWVISGRQPNALPSINPDYLPFTVSRFGF